MGSWWGELGRHLLVGVQAVVTEVGIKLVEIGNPSSDPGETDEDEDEVPGEPVLTYTLDEIRAVSPLVALALVRGVRVEDGSPHIVFSKTGPGFSMGGAGRELDEDEDEDEEDAVGDLPGLSEVRLFPAAAAVASGQPQESRTLWKALLDEGDAAVFQLEIPAFGTMGPTTTLRLEVPDFYQLELVGLRGTVQVHQELWNLTKVRTQRRFESVVPEKPEVMKITDQEGQTREFKVAPRDDREVINPGVEVSCGEFQPDAHFIADRKHVELLRPVRLARNYLDVDVRVPGFCPDSILEKVAPASRKVIVSVSVGLRIVPPAEAAAEGAGG